MKTRHSADIPRPLLILGIAQHAADLALRRVLHAKERGQALVVVDYQGTLSSLLTERNKGNLHKSPLLWCDLANRRRPTALFRFTQSPGMKQALQGFLENCVRLVAASVSKPTIDAVVDVAYRLAEQGSIGLAALLQSLRRPEVSHPLRKIPECTIELDRLVELLDWALRFPSVWSLSEGNNGVDLNRQLTLGGTVWIELPGSHFERIEHQIASLMVDAALADALLCRTAQTPPSDAQRPAAIFLYGFPNLEPLPVAMGTVEVKHVGLFSFSATDPLPVSASRWLEANADCWIAGAIGELPASQKTVWLDETERSRLKHLEPGQVWVRSGASGKAVTTLVRPPETSRLLAPELRRQALKRLRLTPVKQFSSALASYGVQTPKNTDLYRELSTKEALYAGWFRVKGHNRHSHGFDRVTIDQFGSVLDVELDQLALELSEGRYRCRPLRTTRLSKPDGDYRILKVACVRDRVLQAACLHLIEPLFDARFSPASFAYRPGRGAHHAVALARSAISSGKHWVVAADIRKCFDSINHDIVLRLMGDVIADRDLLQLIRHWLVTDVIDFMDVIPSELGVAQGEAISPLLANIYLDPMDKEFEKSGIRFVRYADDYVVLCNTELEAQAALRLMGEFLQGVLRLTLKPAKTHYCHISNTIDGGVGFLGFSIGLSDVRLPPGKVARTLQTVGVLVDAIASLESASMEKYQAILTLNSRIRGFRNYFLIDNAPGIRTQLTQMDAAMEDRIRRQYEAGAVAGSVSDPVWASREKFLPDADDGMRQSRIAAEVNLLTGAYPLDRSAGTADELTASLHDRMADQPPPPAPGQAIASSGDNNSDQATDPDVLVIDGRLHVMKSGCFVTVNAGDLVVRRRKNEIFRTEISELTMVYLEGKGIALSADLTMRLCDKDIPVVFTPLIGVPAAIAQPIQSTRSNLRQQQVLRRNDPDIFKAGLGMVAAKVANQASVLKYFARYRKRTNDAIYSELTQSANDIRSIAETLDSFDPAAVTARASIMGFEGRAAAKYWGAFAILVPADLSFPGRYTRHATDPVNSAINYVYGMLYGEVWRAVVRAGLDPYFGIMHGTARDQGSLIFDLIEEYRAPFGDRLVLGMLGRGLALEFDKEGFLRTACRHKLVRAFHKQWHREVRSRGNKMRTPSDILEMQVTSLKNTYLGTDEYQAFRFQW